MLALQADLLQKLRALKTDASMIVVPPLEARITRSEQAFNLLQPIHTAAVQQWQMDKLAQFTLLDDTKAGDYAGCDLLIEKTALQTTYKALLKTFVAETRSLKDYSAVLAVMRPLKGLGTFANDPTGAARFKRLSGFEYDPTTGSPGAIKHATTGATLSSLNLPYKAASKSLDEAKMGPSPSAHGRLFKKLACAAKKCTAPSPLYIIKDLATLAAENEALVGLRAQIASTGDDRAIRNAPLSKGAQDVYEAYIEILDAKDSAVAAKQQKKLLEDTAARRAPFKAVWSVHGLTNTAASLAQILVSKIIALAVKFDESEDEALYVRSSGDLKAIPAAARQAEIMGLEVEGQTASKAKEASGAGHAAISAAVLQGIVLVALGLW